MQYAVDPLEAKRSIRYQQGESDFDFLSTIARGQLVLRLRFQHRIARMLLCLMKRPLQISLLDEEIVHEELAADEAAASSRPRRQAFRAFEIL